MVQIKISSKPLGEDIISPLIYGNFMEFIDNHINGMWAEMMKNRSFEEDYPPSLSQLYYFNDITDRPWQAWSKTGDFDGTSAAWSMDPKEISEYWIDKAVHDYAVYWSYKRGFRSYHIKVAEHNLDGESGVMQEGITIEKGITYHLRLFLKQKGIQGPIKVSLVKNMMSRFLFCYASAEFNNVSDWEKRDPWSCCEAKLTPSESSENAALLIHFASAGELWIDNVSLMPAENIKGWRKDVVKAVNQLKPGIMRLGGCFSQHYHWREGVGPRDDRVPFQNKVWGRLEENDVGTNEFLEFCRYVNVEPMTNVNVLSGDANEAAEWVEYCNSPPDKGLGRLRARHGYTEPWNVKYWQLGNEAYRKYSMDEFSDICVDFSKAMKSVDDSITIIGPHTPSYDDQGLDEMLDVCGEHVDFVDIRTGKESVIEKVEAIIGKHDENRKIRIASTEWIGLDVDKPPINYVGRVTFATMGYALGVAMGLNVFERHAQHLRIGNHNGLTNQWYHNAIQTNSGSLFFSPTGRVLEMYANNRGDVHLAVESDKGDLDLSASLDIKGKTLCLRAVNASSKDIRGEICSDDYVFKGKMRSYCVKGDSLYDINDFEFPNRISTLSKKIDVGKDIVYKFPPFSAVTLLVGLS